MNWIIWVTAGVIALFVVAVIVGVLIGRVIRNRDQQIPRDEDEK